VKSPERDRGVRGSIASAPWEENTHAHDEGREANIMRFRVASRSAEAVSSVVKRSSPPVMSYGAQDSVGRPRRESGEREPGTHEVWVHAVRLGGRHRSYASRVFHSFWSQGRWGLGGR